MDVTILGESTRSASNLNAWLKSKGCPEYADMYIEHGKKYGVRGDMALFQSCLETGWFWRNGTHFDVDPKQNNFAGLGATGNGVHGDYFPSPSVGIEAQIQDLALRCGVKIPKEHMLSEYARKVYDILVGYNDVYWSQLAGQWAADKEYWSSIQKIMNEYDSWAKENGGNMSGLTVNWYDFIPGETPTICAMSDDKCVDKITSEKLHDVVQFLQKNGYEHNFCIAPKGKPVPELYKKEEPKPSKKFVCVLDPGHSNKKPGARSNDGKVREEVLNLAMAEEILGILEAAGVDVTLFNPDPDDLVAVGKKGWGNVDVMLSLHHNSYDGSGNGNPYICSMTSPSAPMKTKQFAQRVSDAIGLALKGTPQETKVFEGTNGMRGVYEAGLTVTNTSAKDPDGKPPVHILVETYFLNKFSNEAQCLEASKRAARAIAEETLKTFG